MRYRLLYPLSLLFAPLLLPAACSGDATGAAAEPLTQPHPLPRKSPHAYKKAPHTGIADEANEDRAAPIRWWFRQRSYPAGTIPRSAYADARAAFTAMSAPKPKGPGALLVSSLPWSLIGPSPLVTDQGKNPPNPNWSPAAGRLGALAVDPSNKNTLYAGGALGGVWKSTDRGKSWAPISDDLASLAISAIVVDPKAPGTIYVGTGNADLYAGYFGQGLFKSTDGGKTWSQPSGDRFAALSIARLVLDPKTGELYVGAQFGSAGWGDYCTSSDSSVPGQGLFRSADGGKTWTELYTGTIVDLDVDMSASPRRLYIDDWATGVHRSLDGGKSWEDAAGLPMDASRVEIGVAPSQPSILYAGVDRSDHGEVYVSTDFGKTFTQILGAPDYCEHQCSYDDVVEVAPDDPGTVYLGGATCSVWKMTDALGPSPVSKAISLPSGDCGQDDQNWTKGYVHADAHVFTFEPGAPEVLYVGSDGGLARTEDGGQSWERLNDGVATIQLYAVCVDPNDPYFTFGGAQDNGPMLRSNALVEWAGITTGDGTGCAIDAGDGQRIAVADQYGSLFLSKDRFASDFQYVFETQPPCDGLAGCGDRVSFVPPLTAHAREPGTFYIGTYRLWRSTEGGADGSWKPISEDLTAGEKSVQCITDMSQTEDDYLSVIAPAPSDPRVIYTGSAAGVLSATFDDGASFQRLDKAPLPGRYLSGIAVDPLDPKTVYASFSGFNANTPMAKGHVFRSFDGGGTWESVDIPMDAPVNTLLGHPTIEGILYAGTDFGVLASNNGGVRWSALGKGLPGAAVYSMSFRQTTPSLVASTYGRSAWELPFSPSLVLNPTEIFLHAQEGDESVSTTLEAQNQEAFGSTLNVSLNTETSFLAVTPAKAWAGGVTAGGVTVKAFTTGKPAGTYEGSINVTVDGAGSTPFTVPVHLEIAPRSVPQAPSPPPLSGLIAGGGCRCRAAGADAGASGPFAAVLWALALLPLLRRRRRHILRGCATSR